MVFRDLVQTCRAAIGDLPAETPVLVQVPGRRSLFSVGRLVGHPDKPQLVIECEPPPAKPKKQKRFNPDQSLMFDLWGDDDAVPVQEAQVQCQAV